jgi:hypothetical protein
MDADLGSTAEDGSGIKTGCQQQALNPKYRSPEQCNGALHGCCAVSRSEMQYKQNHGHNQSNVNKRGGDMKCEKPEQPKNDQNCGDNPKHVSSPSF